MYKKLLQCLFINENEIRYVIPILFKTILWKHMEFDVLKCSQGIDFHNEDLYMQYISQKVNFDFYVQGFLCLRQKPNNSTTT